VALGTEQPAVSVEATATPGSPARMRDPEVIPLLFNCGEVTTTPLRPVRGRLIDTTPQRCGRCHGSLPTNEVSEYSFSGRDRKMRRISVGVRSCRTTCRIKRSDQETGRLHGWATGKAPLHNEVARLDLRLFEAKYVSGGADSGNFGRARGSSIIQRARHEPDTDARTCTHGRVRAGPFTWLAAARQGCSPAPRDWSWTSVLGHCVACSQDHAPIMS